MTFTELVEDVMGRLNLSSTDARHRIGQRINDHYRRITSSIGLITSRRVVTELDVDPEDPDFDDLPDLVIDGMEKVLRITRNINTGGVRVLRQQTFDEISNERTHNSLPTAWALKRMGSGEVTITLDGFPETTEFTLTIEGYDVSDELVDDAEPAFSADFHDVLVEAVLSDELRKMEKPQLAAIAENKYHERLSDLRMFIAKSGYLDIMQGKNPDATYRRYRFGYWNLNG